MRTAWTRTATALVGLALVVGSCTPAHADRTRRQLQPAPTVIVEITCLYPDAATLRSPVRSSTPDGTAVDAWCGDRIEVSAGACSIRRGTEVMPVRCTES